MKNIALLAIAFAIYDIPHDPTRVVVEACKSDFRHCVVVVMSREKMDDPKAVDALAEHLEKHLIK